MIQNREKLRNAEKEHDEKLMKITKRFADFNTEGMRDIYFDLLTVYSTFGGSLIGMSNSLKKTLEESFGCK